MNLKLRDSLRFIFDSLCEGLKFRITMKSLSLLFTSCLFTFLLFSCKTLQTQVNVAPEKTGLDSKVPVLEWDKTLVEFGKIEKGDQRVAYYNFTNTSDIPVQIELATTCHCTQLEYPPVSKVFHKGDTGTIKATFDSSEKEKSEKIDITIILTNTDSKGYPVIEEVFFSYEL